MRGGSVRREDDAGGGRHTIKLVSSTKGESVVNYSEVIQALNAILTEQKNAIGEFSQSSGGWEGWLQIEMWKRWDYGKVYREESVWGDRRAIDLWFPETKFGVELKCLGLKRTEDKNDIFSKTYTKYSAFAEGVLTDVEKVATLPQGGTGIAIVVIPTWLPEAQVLKLKTELSEKTFTWDYMGDGGFYVGVNRCHYL
jgi:hypothetical protein